MSEVSSERYRPLWAGSLGSLGVMIRIAKLVAAARRDVPGLAGHAVYARPVQRPRLTPLDNARYAGLVWTPVHGHLATLDWA